MIGIIAMTRQDFSFGGQFNQLVYKTLEYRLVVIRLFIIRFFSRTTVATILVFDRLLILELELALVASLRTLTLYFLDLRHLQYVPQLPQHQFQLLHLEAV